MGLGWLACTQPMIRQCAIHYRQSVNGDYRHDTTTKAATGHSSAAV